MTSTQFFTWLYNGICIVIAVVSELAADSDFLAFVPPKYKHAVAIVCLVVMAVKSKMNLNKNPDGTPASVAYKPGLAAIAQQQAAKKPDV